MLGLKEQSSRAKPRLGHVARGTFFGDERSPVMYSNLSGIYRASSHTHLAAEILLVQRRVVCGEQPGAVLGRRPPAGHFYRARWSQVVPPPPPPTHTLVPNTSQSSASARARSPWPHPLPFSFPSVLPTAAARSLERLRNPDVSWEEMCACAQMLRERVILAVKSERLPNGPLADATWKRSCGLLTAWSPEDCALYAPSSGKYTK